MRVDDQKFVGNKVELIFSPIKIEFNNVKSTQANLVSRINVEGFKLNIDDEISKKCVYSNYMIILDKIVFEKTNISLYDNHQLDLIKFISSFLSYILKDAIRTAHHKKKMMNIATVKTIPSLEKKRVVELIFKHVVVSNIIDCEDVLIIKCKDFQFIVDEVN